jgi:DNA mismatch repair protein MutL
MTFLRVTDNGCGMSPEDAKTAFLRHATSKLRTAEDLAAIATMGFRGEALAAIASVSRIDLMTKTAGSIMGTSLHLEAGTVTEESEAGCPDGTTIIIRDLFFNTPARMKFMKADSVEGSRVAAAVQMQALAHPEVAFTFIRDGKQTLSTPGTGGLEAAVYSVYGRECAKMVKVESRWEQYSLTGYVTKPTDSRPSRNLQTFFVNDRPVKSKLLVAALEEAYRNQIMVGKFPACVLHLTLPATAVDVNVHPAKTEVKFLSEKAVFDCVHYGVLGALNKTPDRPQVQFTNKAAGSSAPIAPPVPPQNTVTPNVSSPKQENFFRTMTPTEYKQFAAAVAEAPQPKPERAILTAAMVERSAPPMVREPVMIPSFQQPNHIPPEPACKDIEQASMCFSAPTKDIPVVNDTEEMVQEALPMPEVQTWRMVGELYNSYIIVEEGDNAFLIDKHAAHERILFEKLKSNQEAISSQTLLTPIPVRLSAEAAAELLSNQPILEELGFEVDEFGENTVLLRQIPMDLSPDDAAEAAEALAADLLNGRHDTKDTVRDEILHTVACKAAIKAGWHTDETELLALVKQVMDRDELKYCPHGRPICITLSQKQLEKQFKRA